MADPADEDLNQPAQDDAEPGAQDEQQTPGDHADARPDSEGDTPEQPGDDSKHDSDPLLLAQQSAPEPKPEATKPEPPAPKASPTTTPKTEPKKPGDPPATEAEPDPTSDLPAEDWEKLSHKAKSQYLSQRKAIKAMRDRDGEAQKARESYQTVEKLRQDQGLDPAEFVNGAVVNGMVKRGDPRVIPLLEQTISQLRKRAGIAEPTPPQQTPAFNPAELLAKIEEAEANFDFDRLAEIKAKLKGTTGAPPAKPAAQPPEPQQPQPRQPAGNAPAPGGDAENAEFQAINDALAGLGVADPVAHVRTILSAHPELANEPPGARLKAVLAKHRAMEPTPQPPRRPAAGQPLSGRGGPVRAAGQQPATVDPLKHAMRR